MHLECIHILVYTFGMTKLTVLEYLGVCIWNVYISWCIPFGMTKLTVLEYLGVCIWNVYISWCIPFGMTKLTVLEYLGVCIWNVYIMYIMYIMYRMVPPSYKLVYKHSYGSYKPTYLTMGHHLVPMYLIFKSTLRVILPSWPLSQPSRLFPGRGRRYGGHGGRGDRPGHGHFFGSNAHSRMMIQYLILSNLI